MLSYQHGYHAGNPADVHKHLVLLAVSQYLLKKDSGIHFFDTHAGKGHYDLTDAQALKKQEFVEGVQRVVAQRDELKGDAWDTFFATLDRLHDHDLNADSLRFYPGSPKWIADLRRPQDRHTVFELHPGEHSVLEQLGEATTGHVIYGDGLAGVVKQLPPRTPRLLVLIDPPYEQLSEYEAVANTVVDIHKKCRHALVLLWYPLLPTDKHQRLLSQLQEEIAAPILQSEWRYKAREGEWGMYGSGMLIMNPPWQLDAQLTELMQPWAERVGDPAVHLVQHLVSE
ncbi:MAG: 23S rRNA (adenine(2030)-N(6))-methyltransferase RlmJ [Idiomarina sp.]|nr:23S rRNA (adenine(2030)-N(6))-methyltransferase RlmJ [Idiomarina sp.]